MLSPNAKNGNIVWWLIGCFCVVTPVVLNSIYFGKSYFVAGVPRFALLTLAAFFATLANFMSAQFIAEILGLRFPGDPLQWVRRTLTILLSTIISTLLVLGLYRAMGRWQWLQAGFDENDFAWACVSIALINIFFTFLMEGVQSYIKWVESEKESALVADAYKQSQLSGLKSQVNPHFLFNSLNTLSSLLQDDNDKAEQFLDEMSKVYRYMFRNNEETMVTLSDECRFLLSYVYMLNMRYGSSLLVHIDITGACRDKLVTPMILQVVIENIIQQNIMSKTSPLSIEIGCKTETSVFVKYRHQPKIAGNSGGDSSSLEELLAKYRLLNRTIAMEEFSANERIVTIPLIETEY